MVGTSPAMTENGINFKLLAEVRKCRLLFRSVSEVRAFLASLEG